MIAPVYRRVIFFTALLVFSACATKLPMGPRVKVMPAPGKPFEVFVTDDRICRQFAEQSIGASPSETASQNAVETAAKGVAIGAAVGALAGGREGAPTGAAIGLLGGTAAGTEQGSYAARDVQLRYDIAYQQCMYAKGNQVPGYQMQQIVPPPTPNSRSRQPALPPPPTPQ
ncbi:MAG TPA: YMGG-like glycine zipper-containing protein [Gallionellaceae bacterium]|nr:YMGG-like glycine zipper-containing protein [Gallionellaceae bacterium]